MQKLNCSDRMLLTTVCLNRMSLFGWNVLHSCICCPLKWRAFCCLLFTCDVSLRIRNQNKQRQKIWPNVSWAIEFLVHSLAEIGAVLKENSPLLFSDHTKRWVLSMYVLCRSTLKCVINFNKIRIQLSIIIFDFLRFHLFYFLSLSLSIRNQFSHSVLALIISLSKS